MHGFVHVTVLQGDQVYDTLIVTVDRVVRTDSVDELFGKPTERRLKLKADGVFLHYLIRELAVARTYRNSFLVNFHRRASRADTNALAFLLVPPPREIIDHGWNERTTRLVRERCELEHILSWLSTLGGAFSALGDYFANCAEMAGKISLNQLRLAIRMNDPSIMSRCRLYLSLSLIQQHRFKLARKIVHREHAVAKAETVKDTRLINMCKGIWCKLKYEYENYRNCKRNFNKAH